jgi:hypothetical protein
MDSQAPGLDREKVGEEHVEVDKFHRVCQAAIRISPASKLHQHIHTGHVSINKEVGHYQENPQGSPGLHF